MKWEKIVGWSLAAAALMLAVVCIGNRIGLDANTWPGWVQAIGSIATILAAMWIANQQYRRDQRNNEQRNSSEEARMAGLIEAIAWEAQEALKAAHEAAQPQIPAADTENITVLNTTQFSCSTTRLREVRVAFQNTLSQPLPYSCVKAVFCFEKVLVECITTVEGMNAQWHATFTDRQVLKEYKVEGLRLYDAVLAYKQEAEQRLSHYESDGE